MLHAIIELEYSPLRKKYSAHYWGDIIPKNREDYRALRAYEIFRTRTNTFVRFGPSDLPEFGNLDNADGDEVNEVARERLEALLKGLLNRMKLVVITLGEGDDAQVIFETLNSKGEPLLAMDLVRNNIFHRAEREYGGSDGQSPHATESLYKKLWDPV